MSEELNNYRPYTAAELSNLLHNERAERAEEINALAVAVGLERVHEAGSILAAVERLAADALSRPAPAPVQVPEEWALVPVEPTEAMFDALGGAPWIVDCTTEVVDGVVITTNKEFRQQRYFTDAYAAMLAASPAAPSVSAWVPNAVALAYGLLWHVNAGMDAPADVRQPSLTPEKAAYEARKVLRDLMTKDQRGDGINAARVMLTAPTASGEGEK